MSERYIAAVEISSSKIIAAVGLTSGNGDLTVKAVEQDSETEGIRYGIIHNLEETSVSVSRLFNRLEQSTAVAPRKITGVVVGLSGRSLRNVTTEVALTLPDDTEITDDILERLKQEALNRFTDPSLEVVDAVPRIYKVGKTETVSPKGAVGNNIKATFDLIVCRPELKRNIRRTIADKLNLRVEGFVVTAMATGHLILTSDEKRLGCMLVDMGAETTTVTIYKQGTLRYFATLPMGGRNITRDITSLGVLEARAEEIKKTSGNAMPDGMVSSLNINGLRLSDISNLIVARSEEIVANIVEQMEYAGLKDSDLSGGIVCIGGGSRLQGIMELLAQQSDLPVRRGRLPEYVRISDPKANHMELAEIAGILYAGATLYDGECVEMPRKMELPAVGEPNRQEEPEEPKREPREPKTRKFFEGIKTRISDFFGTPEDDSELIE